MLIKFSVENWQSFRDEASLSMLASKEQQHKERLSKIDKYKIRLLPVAAIYGGNASGKTKFFNALEFAKKFVVKVTQPESTIPREYFKLDSTCVNKPTKFSFEILIDDACYEFSFSVTQKEVTEEKLVKISSHSEKILYHRGHNKISFPDELKLRSDNRLQFVADGTRENQLFLTSSVDQKIKYFQPVYDWFKHSLILINPSSLFSGLSEVVDGDNPMYSPVNISLSQLDTGITHLGGVDISLESIQMPEELKAKIIEGMSNDDGGVVLSGSNGRIFFSKKNGAIKAKRLVSYHKSFEGNKIPFELNQESAGTLRIIDLLPKLQNLKNHKVSQVYVIDELDRCLHTMMTHALLKDYLQSCSSSTRSQLLFTTHDLLLMDQDLLRRDEIWITERDNKGCSSLTSLGEYKNVRYDKDIRKSYLKGSFGGIPKILLSVSNK